MAKATREQTRFQGISFGKRNLYLLSIGLITIVIGYILMAQPPVDGFLSRTLAPVVLVIAYLVIIPVAIFIRDKKKE